MTKAVINMLRGQYFPCHRLIDIKYEFKLSRIEKVGEIFYIESLTIHHLSCYEFSKLLFLSHEHLVYVGSCSSMLGWSYVGAL